jgi:hypothetical protein
LGSCMIARYLVGMGVHEKQRHQQPTLPALNGQGEGRW